MATSVYIDGFNLYYGLLRGKANRRWLDPAALSARLLPGATLAKIKYFTARVRDFDESGAHQRQDVYLKALRTIPHLDIIEGSFRVDARRRKLVDPLDDGTTFVKVWIPEEKGSDVNLAAHLVLDGAHRRYDQALVITNDSDLAEPIRLVQHELNKDIIIAHPSKSIAGALRNVHPADSIPIQVNSILQSQLPDPVLDRSGHPIRKPRGW